jgi:hypothetical protein
MKSYIERLAGLLIMFFAVLIYIDLKMRDGGEEGGWFVAMCAAFVFFLGASLAGIDISGDDKKP